MAGENEGQAGATGAEGQGDPAGSEGQADTTLGGAAAEESRDSQAGTEDQPSQAGDKGGEDKIAGAPEKYEWKAPEGSPEGFELNQEALAKFEPIARELNLTQEQADKLVALQTEITTAAHAAQVKASGDVRAGWLKDSKADAEIGGQNWDEAVKVAQAGMRAFGTPELGKLMDDLGIGDHPEVIRAFYRAGKAVSDDKIHGGGSQPGERDVARTIYHTMDK